MSIIYNMYEFRQMTTKIVYVSCDEFLSSLWT